MYVLIYMNYIYDFILLAHSICLYLAMIVYSGADDVAGGIGEA